MAKRKSAKSENKTALSLPPRPAAVQLITDTIETNYMPYAMSVIISRAIPEIDGFKPAQRRLLYTMYDIGLISGQLMKSANIVGRTMKLNPHGDASIYETLVRLTRGNASLIHYFIESKGNFGKQYSSEMQYAAARYTECTLAPICEELFDGIDRNAVDMVPNYDNTAEEPVLLPTTFPNVLVSPNLGIAVGMASKICSFNLSEVCDAATAMLKNPKTTVDRLLDIMVGPDFSGGGYIVYNREEMKQIYSTGRGSIKLRSRYVFDKEANCIEVRQIPYSTSIEIIIKKITDLVRDNKLREIVDVRDEIGLDGFCLAIDIRRGCDPDAVMEKLFRLNTSLQDTFDCNFNILIDGSPRQMGIQEILTEWIRFRLTCYCRELNFDLKKKNDRLHLLLGLGKILLDIDKAVAIVRGTEHESEVVPNLMKAFGIDAPQAEFIAEIKLRHLNREYIINRIKDIENLQAEIAEIESILSDELKQKAKIIAQLAEIKKEYGEPRRTQILAASEIKEAPVIDLVENYNVRVVLTREGYFKKITMQSLRGNDAHKLKDGDEIVNSEDTDNRGELLIFTDLAQVYKAKISDFENVKASDLGDYLPAKLSMDEGEHPVMMKVENEYSEKNRFVFIFENGKGVRVPVSAYQTKTNRRKLSPAFSPASHIAGIMYENGEPFDIMLINDCGRAISFSTKLIPEKATRTAGGVQLFKLKKNQRITRVLRDFTDKYEDCGRYRKTKLPASGTLLLEKDIDAQQIKITD